MRIAIYTICLNEVHETDEWLRATNDADCRVVVDTGSTDGTPESLAGHDIDVYHAAILPWRFDDAFNTALSLVPRTVDVCFRVDMDERPRPGWRQAIETEFDADTTMLRYHYNWSQQINFYCDRVHRRQGYRWHGATHEGLVWRGDGPERQKFINSMTVDHFQKPKNRPNDLKLLREAVNENPKDARLRLYYARELVWKNAIEAYAELEEFQKLSKVDCDLAYSYRLLAKVDPAKQLDHLQTAQQLDPSASVYLDLADYWYARQDWQLCHRAIETCLAKLRATTVGNWTDDLRLRTSYPYDIASVAAWNVGSMLEARNHVNKAIELNPSDSRLRTNLALIEASMRENEQAWRALADTHKASRQ